MHRRAETALLSLLAVRTLETWTPRRGVSIPCMSVLDPDGGVIEEDQRRLTRYLIQRGRGADILFAMGTTGEWNRLDAARRHRVIQIIVEEARKAQPRLAERGDLPVEAWVGITAPTRRETLETLDLALDLGADAGVIAPLALSDVDDPVCFMQRDVADLLDARERRLPLFLYDNADIASGREVRLRTRQVKALSRLDFVRGIKVSAPPRRLGHYAKAARQFRDLGAFAIYIGNAPYIFDMMRPRRGLVGTLLEHWNRFRVRDMLPAGVVAGPANLLPREWQRAWQVSCAGDLERMDQMRRLIQRFRTICTFSGVRLTNPAVKRGLLRLGVISSDAMASGNRGLLAEEAAQFDSAFEALRGEIEAQLPERWRSDPAEAVA
jgi:dihydrodipicolinate synthase/N-acetylneuraminate lyase